MSEKTKNSGAATAQSLRDESISLIKDAHRIRAIAI
jgi:hypothetical protein